MKRGGALPRRTPQAARTGLARGASQLGRGKRLAPRSAKRVVADEGKPAVREAVFARDRHRCLLSRARDTWGPCMGVLTPHHLRKAGQGGAYHVDVLVTLCACHNDMVEDRPTDAHALGLVCREGETVDGCWAKLAANGLLA